MKKILLLLALFSFNIFFGFADNSAQYHIKSYDVNIDINQDKTINVRESLIVNFVQPSNGIIKSLPLNMALTGSFKRNFNDFDPNFSIKIQDVKVVGLPVLVVNADGFSNIRMGNFEDFMTGQKQILISYKVYGAINQSGDQNLFFWDLIGETLDTYSEKTTFKINLSKSLDFGANDFIIDYPQNNSGLEIKMLANAISGTVFDSISSFRGLKIFFKIPESYFEQSIRTKIYLFCQENLVIIMIIIFIIIVILFGFWLSKDPDFDRGL